MISDFDAARAQQVRESMGRLIAEAERKAARLGFANVAEILREAKVAAERGIEKRRDFDLLAMLC